MQDILPQESHEGRSIREIPLPTTRRAPIMPDAPPVPGQSRRSGGGSLAVKILLASLSACIIAVIVAMFFASATVAVTVQQVPVTLPATVQAEIDAPVGTMPYKQITATAQATRTVTATGSSNSATPAQGTITIYNANPKPQALVTKTRFQTPDGKIYRITGNVSIPAATKDAAGAMQPGTAQATAVADKPGSDYNIGNTQFTIPGFKNSPNFTTVYAQTTGISGASSGPHPVVSPADVQKAQVDIKQELAQKLGANSTTSAFTVPSDSLSVDGTVSLEFGDPVMTAGTDGTAIVTETATATEAIVGKADLATALATQQITGYSGAAINFAPSSNVTLALAPGSAYSSQVVALSVVASGTGSLVWQFDPEQIRQALAGKNKSTFDTTMAGFAPAISDAKASFIPIWNTTFPKNPEKIKINIAPTE